MANVIKNIRIKTKGDTAANWAASDLVPYENELVIETDTNKIKIGDGINVFSDLPYVVTHYDLDELMKSLEVVTVGIDVTQLGLEIEEDMLYVVDVDTGEHSDYGVDVSGLGSGGGGGSTAYMTFTLTKSSITVTTGKDCVVGYKFVSKDENGDESGEGTLTVKVGETTVYKGSIAQGTGSVTIASSALEIGTNTLTLTCEDTQDKSITRTGTITVVELGISTTLDVSSVISGTLAVKYTVTGSGLSKYVHVLVDDTEVYTSSALTKASVTATATIPKQTGGTHTIVVYASASLDDGSIATTEELYYQAIWSGASDPSIAISYADGQTVDEGDIITVPYLVYDPSDSTATVVREVLDEDGAVYSTATAVVDQTLQTWSINDYPTGTVTLRLTCGTTVATVTVYVNAVDIGVETDYSAQTYKLSAVGRSNSDSSKESADYGEVSATLEGFNYASDGWTGETLRFTGGETFTVGSTPFGGTARSTGMTIEVEFTTLAVTDPDAVMVSCMNGGVGFEITPHTATINSGVSSKTIYFAEGDRTRITIAVQPTSEDRLVRMCINGVPSGVYQYSATDYFAQTTPVGITFGCDSASFDLHTVRIHGTGLTMQQCIGNWVMDRDTSAEKLELAAMNDVYDDYGELDGSKIEAMLPVLYVTGEATTSKSDKKSVVALYTHTDSAKSFYDALAKWYVQGTSSTGFPVKNLRLQLAEDYHLLDDDAGQSLLCLKANYMDSSNAMNTGTGNFFHNLYRNMKLFTPPMTADNDIRMCIAGYPFILMRRDDDGDSYEFEGIYTINYDKKSGGTEVLYGAESAVWYEFANNVSAHCLFQSAERNDDLSTNIEIRYGDEDDSASWDVILAAIQYVIDCKDDPDTFKAGCAAYFDVDFLCAYYVLTECLGMADSRGKNMVMGYWPDVSNVLYTIWYDMDTSAGRNNEGVIAYPYDMEAHSTYGTTDAYNAEPSELWKLVEVAFADEIQAMYKSMRSNGLTMENIQAYYKAPFAGVIPASLYAEDSVVKYETPMLVDGTDQLALAQGDWMPYFLRWVRMSMAYRDSKYLAGDHIDTENRISMRIYTPNADNITDTATQKKVAASIVAVPPSSDFEIGTDIHYYPSVLYGANGQRVQAECEEGGTTTVVAPDLSSTNDLETYIEGAAHVTSVGDLSNKYPGSLDVSKAEKLQYCDVGNRTAGYYNTNLTTVSFGNNLMLKRVTLSNSPNLTSVSGLDGAYGLEEFYAEGTALTAVDFPDGCALKTLVLPDTLKSLVLKHMTQLETLEVGGYDNIETLWVEGTPVDIQSIVESCSGLNRVRLIDVDWTLNRCSSLLRLMAYKGIDASGEPQDAPVVTGKCYVAGISEYNLARLNEAFPNLVITYGEIVDVHTVVVAEVEETGELEQILDADLTYEEGSQLVCSDGTVFNYDADQGIYYADEYILPTRIEIDFNDVDVGTSTNVILGGTLPGETNTTYEMWRVGSDALAVRMAGVRYPTSGTYSITAGATVEVENGVVTVDGTTLCTVTEEFRVVALAGKHDGTTNKKAVGHVKLWNKAYEYTIFHTQYVDDGDDAVDPVATGLIDTPTKESSVDTNYYYEGLSGDLTNITKDTTITVKYAESVRQYTYKYAVNGVVVQTATVDVYTDVTYEGDIPEADGKIFAGWTGGEHKSGWIDGIVSDVTQTATFSTVELPSVIKVLGNYDYIYSDSEDYSSAYTLGEFWAICESGLASTYWDIGDEILMLPGTSTITDTEIVLSCHSFKHFKLADGSGEFAKTTWFMPNLLNETRQWHTTYKASMCWHDGTLAAWLDGTLYPTLPQWWQGMIKLVEVLANNGWSLEQDSVVAGERYLYIPCCNEIGWETTTEPYMYEVDDDADEKSFAMYTSNAARVKYCNGTASYWWTRSGSAAGTQATNGIACARSVKDGGGSYPTAIYANYYGVCLGSSI